MREQMIKKIERIVEDACKSDSNAFGYGIWSHHIVYVVKCAKQLAEKLSADSEIVEIAALLHDYAGIKDCTLAEEHHIYGAVEAERILIEFNYPKDRIEKFFERLQNEGITVTVRRTLGADINASCGQLKQGCKRGGEKI